MSLWFSAFAAVSQAGALACVLAGVLEVLELPLVAAPASEPPASAHKTAILAAMNLNLCFIVAPPDCCCCLFY
jgi:hypothetical protein